MRQMLKWLASGWQRAREMLVFQRPIVGQIRIFGSGFEPFP
jgi:hypothetical protein